MDIDSLIAPQPMGEAPLADSVVAAPLADSVVAV